MIKNFIKGIIIGIAKIIPGVSGSVLAISLGVYQKCINILNNFYKIKKQDFVYIFPIILGILFGVLGFSMILKVVYNDYYLVIMLLFTGFIVGDLQKDICVNLKKDILYYLLGIIVIISLPLFNIKPLDLNNEYFFYAALAFIEAFTMIIPGISGTAILMAFGLYDFYLSFISSLVNPVFWINHFFEIFIYTIFLLISGYLTIKVTHIFFKFKYSDSIIRALMFFTIVTMLKKTIIHIDSSYDVIMSIIYFSMGIICSICFNKIFSNSYNKVR